MLYNENDTSRHIIVKTNDSKDDVRKPTEHQITAWKREIIAGRQAEAAKDIFEKNAEFESRMAEAETRNNQVEIDYAASLIRPMIDLQKIKRQIQETPHLKRAYAILEWSKGREDGALKSAAMNGFFVLADKMADKILSIPRQEQILAEKEDAHKAWRDEQMREREQALQCHNRLIQHLEIMRTDPHMRAYDHEILDRRISGYVENPTMIETPVIATSAILTHMAIAADMGTNFKTGR